MISHIKDDCTALGGSCVDWRFYVCHAGLVETEGVCGDTGDPNVKCCLSCGQECELRRRCTCWTHLILHFLQVLTRRPCGPRMTEAASTRSKGNV